MFLVAYENIIFTSLCLTETLEIASWSNEIANEETESNRLSLDVLFSQKMFDFLKVFPIYYHLIL